VQIIVLRLIFNGFELRTQAPGENYNFKIFFLKQNFASVVQVPRKTLAQVLVFDIFCEKKNASLTVAMCD
jgi:hypothetical protein